METTRQWAEEVGLGGRGPPSGPVPRVPAASGPLLRGGVSWLRIRICGPHVLPVRQAQPCHIPAGCHGDGAALQLWSSYQGTGHSWWLSLSASQLRGGRGRNIRGGMEGARDHEAGEQAFLGLNMGWGDPSVRGCLSAPLFACERRCPHLFLTCAHSAPPSSHRTFYPLHSLLSPHGPAEAGFIVLTLQVRKPRPERQTDFPN